MTKEAVPNGPSNKAGRHGFHNKLRQNSTSSQRSSRSRDSVQVRSRFLCVNKQFDESLNSTSVLCLLSINRVSLFKGHANVSQQGTPGMIATRSDPYRPRSESW